MSFLAATISSFLSGIAVCFAVVLYFSFVGDCAIGGMAKALAFGLPTGNAIGVLIYRTFAADPLTRADAFGTVFALLLAFSSALAGIMLMDRIGFLVGASITAIATCLLSAGGYWLAIFVSKRRSCA